jgi:hypothetical protein
VGAREARLSPESPPSFVIAVIGRSRMFERKSKMIEQGQKNENRATARTPGARYAYYRRCQVFKRNGAQCKAPAEKGSHICHAHAGQLATAVRRERERRAMLAEAVAEMRRRGRPECEMADLFTDFDGIQVTLAVMARAVITGKIDCKTAGQMVVQLQTVSKLLRVYHRVQEKASTTKYTKKHEGLPQICADDRRLGTEKTLTTKDTKKHEGLRRTISDDAELKESGPEKDCSLTVSVRCADRLPGASARVLQFDVMAFGDRCRAHGPPDAKAA